MTMKSSMIASFTSASCTSSGSLPREARRTGTRATYNSRACETLEEIITTIEQRHLHHHHASRCDLQH